MSSTTSGPGAGARAALATLARWGEALSGRLAALLVLVAAGLYLALFNQYTGNYDEGVYWQSLRAMAAGHALFTPVFSSQPPYFLLSVYPFYLLFGQTIAAARIGVAIFGLLGVVSMYWLASQLGGRWAGLIGAALLAFEPYYLQQARALESDGPAVAVSVLAVALAVAATRRAGKARRWLIMLSGMALAWGVLIKLDAVVALAPILLLLLAPLLALFDAGEGWVKRPDAAGLRRAARAVAPDLGWLAAGLIGAFVLLLAPFAGSLGTVWAQVVGFHLAAQVGLPASLTNDAGAVARDFLWLGALALVAVGAAVWRRAWRMVVPLAWLLIAIVVALRLRPFFAHYAALATPGFALTIALAPGLLALLLPRPRARWASIATTALILAVLVAMLASDVSLTGARLAQGIPANAQAQFAAINSFTTPGEEIVTDDPYLAAQADHSVPPQLVDTSYVRVRTGSLTAAQIERVIERDHIRIVILATNRLATIPGFMPWLVSEFALAARSGRGGINGDGYQVYIRVPSGTPVA